MDRSEVSEVSVARTAEVNEGVLVRGQGPSWRGGGGGPEFRDTVLVGSWECSVCEELRGAQCGRSSSTGGE